MKIVAFKTLLIKHINIVDATETITEIKNAEARSPRRRTPSPTKTTLIISSPINQHSQNSIGLSPTKIELSTDVKDEIIGIHGETIFQGYYKKRRKRKKR